MYFCIFSHQYFVCYLNTFDEQVFVFCNKILFDIFVPISALNQSLVHMLCRHTEACLVCAQWATFIKWMGSQPVTQYPVFLIQAQSSNIYIPFTSQKYLYLDYTGSGRSFSYYFCLIFLSALNCQYYYKYLHVFLKFSEHIQIMYSHFGTPLVFTRISRREEMGHPTG